MMNCAFECGPVFTIDHWCCMCVARECWRVVGTNLAFEHWQEGCVDIVGFQCV